MKSSIVLLPLILAMGSSASAATLLFQDNFNTADGSLTASTAGRLSGLAAGETALQGFGNAQSISGNQLRLAGNGGVRFGPETNRYNWAGGTTGAAILAAGGFTVTLDWTYSLTSGALATDWLAFKIGGPNGDTNVNTGSVDYSFLLRQNGGVQSFDSGVSTGDMAGLFTPTANVTVPVAVTYLFGSFADGTNVNVIASVNGTEVVNSNFTWDGNSNQLFFEIAADDPMLIDNLTLTTVPEPGTASLALVGALALFRRKR